jgi:hypothetical protein
LPTPAKLPERWNVSVGPLRALEILDRAIRRLDDDVLAVQRLERRRLGDQDLAAAVAMRLDRRRRQLERIERRWLAAQHGAAG